VGVGTVEADDRNAPLHLEQNGIVVHVDLLPRAGGVVGEMCRSQSLPRYVVAGARGGSFGKNLTPPTHGP
jgi:hypothetical protein